MFFWRSAIEDLYPLHVFNVRKAAQYPLDLGLDYLCTLEEMLDLLGSPFRPVDQHDAGNYANYILRVLLCIAVLDAAGFKYLGHDQKKLLSLLDNIAREPILPKDRPIENEFSREIEEHRRKRHQEKKVALELEAIPQSKEDN